MLKMEQVRKKYDTFELSCSLRIKEGFITGLIGPNGAGKSTTFKAILDLVAIDSGKIQIFGKDYKTLTTGDKEKIGVVMGESGFSGYLTIKDIIPILNELYHKFDKQMFIQQVERFQLPLQKPLNDFSNGMNARLKLLIAMSHDAKLLILDEPTAGLDVIARDELLNMLREYMESDGRSILISSHISSDLEHFCDDIYMMQHGKIMMHEETDRMLDSWGFLKVDENQYKQLDKRFVTFTKKERYGYCCLVNEKQFYMDNYPGIVIEKSSIDEFIKMMERGKRYEGITD